MLNESSGIGADGISLREGCEADVPAIVQLVNTAFAVESFFVDRPRTYAEQLLEQLGKGHFLLAHRGTELVASVYYEVRGERGYIGMLAVRPGDQRGGLGRAMMQAAEQALRERGCGLAEIAVVSVRTSLPPLYRKLGYTEAGLEEPHEDLRRKLRMPVQLIRMEKPL